MRVLRLCLVIALGVGCGAPPSPPRSAPVARPAPPPPPPWPRFAEVASWLVVGEPFPNRGHWGDGTLATVRVSPGARAPYEALVTDSVLPDGSVIALFHAEASRPGRVFVMQKEAGSWRYLALAPSGVVLPVSEAACRGCHAGAVGDSLFGLPRPKPMPSKP